MLTLRKEYPNRKIEIPQKYRIGHTCFLSVAVIGGKLYIKHPKIGTVFIKTEMDFYQLSTH